MQINRTAEVLRSFRDENFFYVQTGVDAAPSSPGSFYNIALFSRRLQRSAATIAWGPISVVRMERYLAGNQWGEKRQRRQQGRRNAASQYPSLARKILTTAGP